MDFRQRLLATLRRLEPLFEEPGVMVVGSEVPNLLQPGVAATLVVSQDVDIGVPVSRHAALKRRLADLRGLHPSPDEPSGYQDTPVLPAGADTTSASAAPLDRVTAGVIDIVLLVLIDA